MSNSTCGCSLPPAQLQARRESLVQTLVPRICETRELADGLALRFDSSAVILGELASFIQFERGCCSFAQFKLIAAAHAGPIWLEITGAQVKEVFGRALRR